MNKVQISDMYRKGIESQEKTTNEPLCPILDKTRLFQSNN